MSKDNQGAALLARRELKKRGFQLSHGPLANILDDINYILAIVNAYKEAERNLASEQPSRSVEFSPEGF